MERTNPPRVCGLDTEGTTDAKLELRRMQALGRREIQHILWRLVEDWFRHRVPRLSASLAFYTLLSMAPLVIVVLGIAGLVFGREAAAGQLVWQIRELVGPEGAIAIQTLVKGASGLAAGSLAAIIGVVTLFFGATAVVAELRDALNTIWEVPEKATAFGWRSALAVLRERTLSFAVVLAFGFLLLVSLAVNAAVTAAATRFNVYLPLPEWALQILNTLISLLVIAMVFAMLFKFLPDIDIAWSDVVLGSLGTAVLFTAGKTLIGLYLGSAGVGSAYGAAGSLVVVLVWVYYSAQIFFIGAEFTQIYADCFGSRPRERSERVQSLTPGTPSAGAKLEVPGEIKPARIQL